MGYLKQLDLGSGASPRQWGVFEAFGVDIFDYGVDNVKVADLALEPIPFENDSFDLVTAYDFLEHIPSLIYLPEEKGEVVELTRRSCMIELFNEIYRVLKHDGNLYMAMPVAGTTEYYRDPTHVYPWVLQSLHYFSGDYFGHHDDYGHTSKFVLESSEIVDGWRMTATLRAVKPAAPPYELGETT